MDCVKWYCDCASTCPNEMICDDVCCIRWLVRSCSACALRSECDRFLKYTEGQVKTV